MDSRDLESGLSTIEDGVDETFILHPESLSEDVLYTLYYLSKDSFLMELYEILGPKNLLTLVKCFGGQTLRIPSRVELMRATRDYSIAKEIQRCVEEDRPAKRKELAERHELRLDTIYAIEKDVNKELAHIIDTEYVDRLKKSSIKNNL